MAGIASSIAREILDQASEWFVVLRDPEASHQQREAFAEWLRGSPQHVRAYLDVARLWGDAAHLGDAGDQELVDLLASGDAVANVVRFAEDSSSRSMRERPGAARATPRVRSVRIAASIVLGMLALGALTWWAWDSDPRYATGAGELRMVRLADGSIIKLNSRSDVVVRLTPTQRLVELREGQALFEVAKDPARPFVVRNGRMSVRAVGTQFDVKQKRSGTVVTVVEGTVAVFAHAATNAFSSWREPKREVAAAEPAPTVLAAGQRVTVGSGGPVSTPATVDVASATSWLQHEVVFDNEPLESVIEELNRYVETPIVLADPELATLRIDAVLQTTNAEALLRFVSHIEGVKIERTDSQIVVSRGR